MQWGDDIFTRKISVHNVDINPRVASASQVSNLEKKLENFMQSMTSFVSPSSVCAICTDNSYPTNSCPLSDLTQEHANQINSSQKPRHDPYSKTYNPGWKNHPNFAWSNNNPSEQRIYPQQKPANPNEPRKPSLKEIMTQFIQTQQQTNNNLQARYQNFHAAIQKLKVKEHIKAIKTLRSGRTYEARPKDVSKAETEGKQTAEIKLDVEDITTLQPHPIPATTNVREVHTLAIKLTKKPTLILSSLTLRKMEKFPSLWDLFFMATAGTIIDVKKDLLYMTVQGQTVEFKVFEAIKKPVEMNECFYVDAINTIARTTFLANVNEDELLTCLANPELRSDSNEAQHLVATLDSAPIQLPRWRHT
ncbi:hypothetical protein L3X38_023918 [Prunus dulcis]|uniref:Uncharacterized protein n=1 Tax=Prunus dulcis TaxID=3755 RepID=A0AAD4Z5X6_PRUDU|nr:hypothetical protein L3X38_023918 [Prunus dulcis]